MPSQHASSPPLRTQLLELLATALQSTPETLPSGRYRPRIDNGVVFVHLISALVLGVGNRKIATDACPATTMRRRREVWAPVGLMAQLHTAVVKAYECPIGLDLGHVCIDGDITKAPCGGECAGCCRVDRGKGGLKRSQVLDRTGVPLAAVTATTNVPDHKLLAESLDALKDCTPLGGNLAADVRVHLDAPAATTPLAAPSWAPGAWRRRSPSGAPRSRWGVAGWWRRPTPG